MIRSLLAERFKLVVHNETKDQPIYALVLARSDGRFGPELKKSETDCAAMIAAARGRGPGRGMPPPGPPQPGERMPCGIRIGMGNMVVGGATLAQLANSLGMFVGRIVQDKTGLTGAYDIALTWTPDQLPQRPPGTPADQPMRINGAGLFWFSRRRSNRHCDQRTAHPNRRKRSNSIATCAEFYLKAFLKKLRSGQK